MPEADVLARLDKWLAPYDSPEPLQVDIKAAIAEIKHLRALVGAVSDLPTESQARLDKAYQALAPYR